MTATLPLRLDERFDPQGHQMGPLGTIAAQMSLVLGLVWSMGALGSLLLPPSFSVVTLAPVLGAFLLAPRSVLMKYPVSFSILGMYTLLIGSIIWTIDALATEAVIKGLLPAMIAVSLAAGLLTLRDLADALVWTVQLVVAITFVALALFPETRLHVGGGPAGTDYAGWHGFFLHKNQMTAFLLLAVPTMLTWSRSAIQKWVTLALVAVLLVGSTSATGATAAVFAVIVYVWLRIYQSQSLEDARNSTLLAFVSVLGSLAVVAAAVSSIATITSAYGKDTSFSGRTEIWEASFEALWRRPLLGHGMSALFWQEGISPETAEIWRHVGFEASHAHNGALDLALQIGLIGLAVFTVLFVTTYRRAWLVLRDQPNLAVFVLTTMSANLVMSLSEDVFLGGWLAMFTLMKVMVIRRKEPFYLPSWRDQPIAKWA
jgi:O-antigen ligase